ncbi:hypothetical protein [Streptomyces sp. TLI_146]|uniref:hypothetical protein n=1 Tax=Streptomyces sp. TLI_146 TaxID=1938858 RepID=UPI000C70080B|nr:hypothetical protein [Streptomyces sp. TLI_146]
MSTTRRPLGTGPRTDDEQSRTQERRAADERGRASSGSPAAPAPSPSRGGRRPLGTGPDTEPPAFT